MAFLACWLSSHDSAVLCWRRARFTRAATQWPTACEMTCMLACVCLWLLRVFLRCREVLCNNHTSDSRFCNASLSSSQQIFDWVKSSDKNHEIPLSLSVYPCFTHDTTWIFTQIEKSRPPNRGCFQASWTEIHGGATLTGGFFTPEYSGYLEDVVFIWMCVFFLFLFPFRRGISLDPKHWKLGLKVLWGAMAMKCTLSHFFVLNESVALPKPKSPWSSNQVKFEIPSPLRKGYITSTLASRRKKTRAVGDPLLPSCCEAVWSHGKAVCMVASIGDSFCQLSNEAKRAASR